MFVYLLLLVLFQPTLTSANLNLFLSQYEVKRLLGLENELYYVRDGTINKYAMGFVVPIPSSVPSLHFTWYSLSPGLLRYQLQATSSHPAALPHPPVNITRAGTVPVQPRVWEVAVTCTGMEAAEVVVTLDIVLTGMDTSHPNNVTNLRFRRKKVCLAAVSKESLKEKSDVDGIPTYVVFFAGVGGCLTLLVIIITIVIVTWMRGVKNKDQTCIKSTHEHDSTRYTALQSGNDTTQITNMMGGHSHSELRSVSQLSKHSNNGHLNVLPMASYRGEPGAYLTSTMRNTLKQAPMRACGDGMTSDAESRVTEWVENINQSGHGGGDGGHGLGQGGQEDLSVDRLCLALGDLLQEGTFGRVYQGCLTRPGCEPEDVMVKTIAPGSSPLQASYLVQEGSLLHPLSHKHLVPLLATTYDGTSPMMIYPDYSPGNMKKWLMGCHQAVGTHQAVGIGLQLLTAIKHIHKRRIVHKDVAARNCYLTHNLSVKLGDPALSRDLFPNDYHCLGDNENRPVKWMAMESISSGQFSRATDVWSWGITLWEVLTRAQQPFPDIDPFEMEVYLAEGFRLHQPLNCPDQLYTVMVSCWGHSPAHRASVQNLYNHLMDFNTQLQQFV